MMLKVAPHLRTSVTRGAPSVCRYQFILLGDQRHICVNNLLRVVREAERPELEPATYTGLVACPTRTP